MRTYRIGKIFGFPIEVRLSFLLLLGFVLLWRGWLGGVFVALLGFGSVLLHELGHALVARRLGVRIAGIELNFFGGAAKMIDPPRSARDEVAIAAAGPAVSFMLAGIAAALAALTGFGLFSLLGWINLVIGLFNLLPALPMDGGRILRALLSYRMGHLRATRSSVTLARGIAVALGVLGLMTLHLQLVLLAVLLWSLGTAELAMARRRAAAGVDSAGPSGEVLVGELMPRGFRAGFESERDPLEALFTHPQVRVILRRYS
ncbi:MAG TPA: M50 family metallopeptidase [Polyangia bacterium]|jgi:Zn-dependent protease|nr:M50 family metallopeptidase [Polyangia bacterium]